jgi:hypothetical protein
MRRVFILVQTTENDYVLQEWRNNGINGKIIYKKRNKILKVIRRIWIKWSIPFENIWYQNWKDDVKDADLIIVHVSYLTLNVCKYINKINPNARVIAWYWNKVDKNTYPSLVKGNCELWSFDEENCKKYNMKFNHQYYFKSFLENGWSEKEWDVYFCGSDSGRGKAILDIYSLFQDLKIKVKFQVVYPKYYKIPDEIKSSKISYEEVRKNIEKSSCILEIVRKGQSGPTLRLMESLYFRKKLITNNSYVISEEFYNPASIFVLGERDINDLKSFIECEAPEYDKKLLDKYDVMQWIENFYI